MSTKYIDNSDYAVTGYALAGKYQSISIGSIGLIGGAGLGGHATEAYTIANSGRIMGTHNGIYLRDGGAVTNTIGALIEGGNGIQIKGGSGTIKNAGTIIGLSDKGVIFDGILTNSAGASIAGPTGVYGTGTVTNSGVISGSTVGWGVHLDHGNITNEAGGLIRNGVEVSYASLTNSGTIVASAGTSYAVYSPPLILGPSTADTLLTNTRGGQIWGAVVATSIDNAGTIIGSINADRGPGEIIINAVGGQIEGSVIQAYSIANSGTIRSAVVGHTVTNIVGALIEGGASAIDVSNAGTIIASQGAGVAAGYQSEEAPQVADVVINGVHALIEGYSGVSADLNSSADAGSMTVVNAGTILATGTQGFGILCAGTISNGENAVVEGDIGVKLDFEGSIGTLRNEGTIISTAGTSGTAVQFQSSYTVLIDEPDGRFVGNVIGDGGTLALDSTGGTLSGFGTRFIGFGALEVLPGANWAIAGATTLGSGVEFANSGRLRIQDALTLDDSVTLSGRIAGNGTLALTGATALFAANTSLTMAHWAMSSETLLFAGTLSYAGGFSEMASLIALARESLTLTGGATFDGGSVEGGGTLSTLGATQLEGLVLDGGAVWDNAGTVIATGALTLGTKGSAGIFSNEKNAVLDIAGDVRLGIATLGSGSTVNLGLIEKTTGAGASTIAGLVANSGTISVTAGTLNLTGVITGSGIEAVGVQGELKLDNSVAAGQTIRFNGTTGTLALDDPSDGTVGFAGTISGFGGSDRLDLASFAFSGKPTLSWSQSSGRGTLTVTDGAETAKIALFGQYATAGFKSSNDGIGGTAITYTPPPSAIVANPHR